MSIPRQLPAVFVASLSVVALPAASAGAAEPPAGATAAAVAPTRGLLPTLPGVPLLTGLPATPEQLTG